MSLEKVLKRKYFEGTQKRISKILLQIKFYVVGCSRRTSLLNPALILIGLQHKVQHNTHSQFLLFHTQDSRGQPTLLLLSLCHRSLCLFPDHVRRGCLALSSLPLQASPFLKVICDKIVWFSLLTSELLTVE